jgi:hypothetical protein
MFNQMTIQRVLETFPNADSFALDVSHEAYDDFSPPERDRNPIRRIHINARFHRMKTFFSFVETYASSLALLHILDVGLPINEELPSFP